MSQFFSEGRFPDITLADIAAELRREGEARARLYPKRVDSGRMTAAEAERGRAIITAMLSDVARMVPPWRTHQEDHEFSWAERRIALQRELAQRARFYPEWIQTGRLDQAEAKRRVDRLTKLLWIYEEGFDWRASNGLLNSSRIDTEEHWQARLECLSLCHEVARQRGYTEQADGLIGMIADLSPGLAAELRETSRPQEQKELAL